MRRLHTKQLGKSDLVGHPNWSVRDFACRPEPNDGTCPLTVHTHAVPVDQARPTPARRAEGRHDHLCVRFSDATPEWHHV